jgi:hypothetical protein
MSRFKKQEAYKAHCRHPLVDCGLAAYLRPSFFSPEVYGHAYVE